MLDSASIAMIVGLVFCVIMSGYFSATETAFTSLNRVRLKSWADGGDQRAAVPWLWRRTTTSCSPPC